MIRSAGRFLLKSAIIALALVTAVTAALVLRLSMGPASLAFLAPVMERALIFGEAGYRVEFDDTVLTWGGWERTLDIRVIGVRVFDAQGVRVGGIPELSVELSARALLKGEVAPTSLEFFGPSARLVRTATGRITLGDAPASDAEFRAGPIIATVLAELLKPPNEDKPIGYLRKLAIFDVDIVMDDHKTGKIWRVPSASLVATRHQTGMNALVSADLEMSSGSVLRLKARGAFDSRTSKTSIEVDFSDLDPANLAGEGGLLEDLAGIEIPINGTVGFELAADGRLDSLSFEIDTSAGQVRLPRFYTQPLPIAGLVARGDYNFKARRLTVETIQLAIDDALIEGQGVVDLSQPGRPDIAFFADLKRINVAQIKRYWPDARAPNARKWIVDNLPEGRVPSGHAQFKITPEMFDLPGLPAEAIDIQFRFEDVSARYMREFPMVTGASGRAHLTGHSLELLPETGVTGNMRLVSGRVLLDQIHRKGFAVGDVDLVVEGSVPDALALLDHPPLTFMSKSPVKPSDTRGETVTRVRLRFPLRRGVKMNEMFIATSSTITGASAEGLLGTMETANGDLRVEVADNRLQATGRATLNGVPVTFVWTEELLEREGTPSRYAVQGVLMPEQLTALGLPGEGFVTGPIFGQVHLVGKGGDIAEGEALFDLRQAEIALDEIGWLKPAGEEGSAGFSVRTDNKRVIVDQFTLTGGGLEARGTLRLDAAFALADLNISDLTLGRTEMQLLARPAPGGGFDVTIQGPVFDAGPLIRKLMTASDGGRPLFDFDLTVALDRVIAENDIEVRDLAGTATYVDDKWDRALFRGFIGDHSELNVSAERMGSKRLLSIRSGDAGEVARALDIYNNSIGGTLSLTAMIDDAIEGGPVIGELKVDDFRIAEAPVLARILTLGSLTGIGDMLSGGGISFDILEVPYRLAGGQLSITGGRAHGAAIGFTMEGMVDNNASLVDLVGTIIPAYSINAALAKVPIVGTILAGPSRESLFAFTFKVSGAKEEPKVSVNPLALLAPSVLREIFSGGRRAKPKEPELEEPAPEPEPEPQPEAPEESDETQY